ncbi:T-snare coiled-coil -like proteiny domain-containing protein [Vairimorpha necatrix]|uniref:T-snare coiled-coil -like proteiny domain-containing protein n=1 Tax=Vairimorpha necatrix TaxID=6039 RepID=A0AAX4JFQ6_9MICR
MNRYNEYLNFLRSSNNISSHNTISYKTLFYDTLRDEIMKINKNITNTLNYKSILSLEKSLSQVTENTHQTLEVIDLEGNPDEVVHYEGIKQIIKELIIKTKQKLEKEKRKKTSYKIELEPIKHITSNNVSNLDLQVEKNEIMGDQVERFSVTRQRLLEIESIQENISEQLILQDENIDDVIEKTKDIYETVKNNKKYFEREEGGGRFMTRFLTILYLCLTFILIFLHFYYIK